MNETIPAQPAAAAESQWHAIVIGIDEYPRMLANRLNSCVP